MVLVVYISICLLFSSSQASQADVTSNYISVSPAWHVTILHAPLRALPMPLSSVVCTPVICLSKLLHVRLSYLLASSFSGCSTFDRTLPRLPSELEPPGIGAVDNPNSIQTRIWLLPKLLDVVSKIIIVGGPHALINQEKKEFLSIMQRKQSVREKSPFTISCPHHFRQYRIYNWFLCLLPVISEKWFVHWGLDTAFTVWLPCFVVAFVVRCCWDCWALFVGGFHYH